jgi:hypothetical protein
MSGLAQIIENRCVRCINLKKKTPAALNKKTKKRQTTPSGEDPAEQNFWGAFFSLINLKKLKRARSARGARGNTFFRV